MAHQGTRVKTVYCIGVVAILGLAPCWPEGDAPPPAQPTGALLVGAVNSGRLFQELGLDLVAASLGGPFVHYRPVDNGGPCDEIGIGVLSSDQDAQREAAYYVLHVSVSPSASISLSPRSRLFVWASKAGRPHCNALLRYENVLLRYGWNGTPDGAIALAKHIAELFTDAPAIAPRATRTAVPEVQITVPAAFLTREATAIQFAATEETALRAWAVTYRAGPRRNEDALGYCWRPQASRRGSVSVYVREPGRYEVELHFATEGNVIFAKTIVLDAVD